MYFVYCSLALLASGALWDDLPPEDGHQCGSPGHRLTEHGCHGRRRAGEEREDSVRGGGAIQPCFYLFFFVRALKEEGPERGRRIYDQTR